MQLAQWLEYIESLHPREIELGLDRVHEVARRMGVDHTGTTVITVAGTNGKGSCVATLDTLLRTLGKRVGSYTSPHLQRYNERILLNGIEAESTALCRAFEFIEQCRGDIPLTYFEFGTLAALLLFQQEEAEVIVLEVGMGGRLDAVNIVDSDVAVITSVDLDHTAWLGETRDQIAREKAGIMRPGRPLVLADRQPPAPVFELAATGSVPVYRIGHEFRQHVTVEGDWHWRGVTVDGLQVSVDVPFLPTLHADVVAAALQALLLLDLLPEPQQLRQALATVRLPGRFEIFTTPRSQSRTILDVAHNPGAAAELCRRLQGLRDTRDTPGQLIAVLAMMADKDVEGFIRALDSVVDIWYIAQVNQARCMPAQQLARKVKSVVGSSEPILFQDVAGAYENACRVAGSEDFIVVTGSFFTVAEIRNVIET